MLLTSNPNGGRGRSRSIGPWLALCVSATILALCATLTAAQERRAAATISGRVIDNQRRPAGKVKILLRGRVIGETGNDGLFSVVAPRAESRLALTFDAEGYVPNTHVFDAKAPGNGNVIVVWPIAYRVKFDASRGLDVELGASRVKVPADALTGPGGERFDGPAVLRFTLLDITDSLQQSAASGDFSGRMLDGSIQRLNSFGIFDLDLRDLAGRQLSLRRGAKVDLAIAVPPKLRDRAPRRVGFFDFDLETGRWIQVGNFEFVPSTLTYNGSVTSFGGAHNLDNPQDTTCVTVQVVRMFDGAGMSNFNVTAHGAQYSSSGTTNASGFVCLLVQRNASFTVDAWGVVGTSYYLTPQQPTFTSPNFSSGAADCGNSCTSCPFLGTVQVDLVVGTGDRRF